MRTLKSLFLILLSSLFITGCAGSVATSNKTTKLPDNVYENIGANKRAQAELERIAEALVDKVETSTRTIYKEGEGSYGENTYDVGQFIISEYSIEKYFAETEPYRSLGYKAVSIETVQKLVAAIKKYCSHIYWVSERLQFPENIKMRPDGRFPAVSNFLFLGLGGSSCRNAQYIRLDYYGENPSQSDLKIKFIRGKTSRKDAFFLHHKRSDIFNEMRECKKRVKKEYYNSPLDSIYKDLTPGERRYHVPI